MSYSVLFRESPIDQLDALAPIIRQVYGVTDFDARAKLHRGWGFLERHATAEEAQRVASAVPGCVAIANTEMQQLSEPRIMTGIEFAANGLKPETPDAPFLEWSDLAIIAAGGLTEEIVHRETSGKGPGVGKMMMGLGVFLVTGIPLGLFGGKKQEVKPVKSNRWLIFGTIITRQGEQFALALDHFSFAGLGTKKQLQGIVNFRTLLGELQQHSSARLNYGARLVVAGRSLSQANYASLTDYETELLWMYNASLLPE
jgi:hypothetical protein